MSLPLFHIGGLGIAMGMTIWAGLSIVLPIPSRPLSAELVIDCLCYSGADAALLVPSIIEELSHSQEAVSQLKKLNYLGFRRG